MLSFPWELNRQYTLNEVFQPHGSLYQSKEHACKHNENDSAETLKLSCTVFFKYEYV